MVSGRAKHHLAYYSILESCLNRKTTVFTLELSFLKNTKLESQFDKELCLTVGGETTERPWRDHKVCNSETETDHK